MPTLTPNLSPISPLAERLRRSARVQRSIRIRVAGFDTGGFAFLEESYSVCVNRQGGCILLLHSVVHSDVLRIKNLQNGIEGNFRVVGSLDRPRGQLRPWGVELLNPHLEIWGSTSASGESRYLWLRCAFCAEVELVEVSAAECEEINFAGAIVRPCGGCGQTARWQPCPPRLVMQSRLFLQNRQ